MSESCDMFPMIWTKSILGEHRHSILIILLVHIIGNMSHDSDIIVYLPFLGTIHHPLNISKLSMLLPRIKNDP
jgi:hypothetical protein